MGMETARQVVDAAARGSSPCISFYGGEPLLREDFIRETVAYAKTKAIPFRFRMTTNGALLSSAFLSYAKAHNFRIALSIDGGEVAHNLHRRTLDGAPTFAAVKTAAERLLKAMPASAAMATVNPDTAALLPDSVAFLRKLGFTSIATTPNFLAPWNEADLAALEKAYQALANWYGDKLLAGDKVKLHIFDAKFINHLTPELNEGRCVPGARSLHIAPDGSVYPCVQYTNHPRYAIGSAESGVNEEKLQSIRAAAKTPSDCASCALRSRCDNRCGCKNLATTGQIDHISPLVCAHERMLIPIADRLGERIFVR